MDIDYSCKDSREHIKKQCQAASESRRNIISPDNEINVVLRLTPTLVVKYGPGVTTAEACGLKFATEHLDHDIVRVPSFVQFFTGETDFWPIGYLAMTFIEGTTLDRSAGVDADIAQKILRAIAHIHSFTHTVLDGAGQRLESVGKLQEYIDMRLTGGRSLIDVTNSTLHLCHTDIAPRNIVVDKRGVICLIGVVLASTR